MESLSVTGQAIVKIYLQPGADVSQAIAQTTAIAQTAVRSMPPGMVPPLIMQYSATAVPIRTDFVRAATAAANVSGCGR